MLMAGGGLGALLTPVVGHPGFAAGTCVRGGSRCYSHNEKNTRAGSAIMNLTVFQILLSLREGARSATEMLAAIEGFVNRSW